VIIQNYSSLEDLARRVDDNQGVITTSMRALRDAYGAERLGKHVRSGLSAKLAEWGLRHAPSELPDSQDEWVRVFRRGSPVEKVIQAARRISPDNDEILREAAANKAADAIQKIRELVCG
jgi:hypothetical protein